MTDSKHTPGPWAFYGRVQEVGNADELGIFNLYCGGIAPDLVGEEDKYRGEICTVQSCDHIGGISREEAEANARLIAAAPDLLEALQCFMDDPRFQVAVGGNPIVVDEMLAKARAALSKALNAKVP